MPGRLRFTKWYNAFQAQFRCDECGHEMEYTIEDAARWRPADKDKVEIKTFKCEACLAAIEKPMRQTGRSTDPRTVAEMWCPLCDYRAMYPIMQIARNGLDMYCPKCGSGEEPEPINDPNRTMYPIAQEEITMPRRSRPVKPAPEPPKPGKRRIKLEEEN